MAEAKWYGGWGSMVGWSGLGHNAAKVASLYSTTVILQKPLKLLSRLQILSAPNPVFCQSGREDSSRGIYVCRGRSMDAGMNFGISAGGLKRISTFSPS